MKYICLVIIFINFTLANEFQKKHLNQEQINFLNEHPTIIVSNEKHWAPYDYNENGEPKGYSIEYIKLIAKKIGIRITFKTDSWSNLIEKIKSKEIDLIHPLAISEERKEFLNFTQTLLKNDKVIVTNDSNLDIKNLADLKNKTLAVGKGWQSTKILKEKYTNIKLKEYNSSLEMLKAVAYGEVDATIDGFLTINYLKQKHLLSNLHLTGRVEIPTLDQNLYIGRATILKY